MIFLFRLLNVIKKGHNLNDFFRLIMLNLIAWAILGLLAGAIAKLIFPGRQGGGFFATMLLGIIGAFVGGTLTTLIKTGSFQIVGAGFSIPGIVVAVIGAIVVIWLWELINKDKAS